MSAIVEEVSLIKSLKKYFGFGGFKGRQQQIIESLLNGKDTLVIMPTGGGKSLCYQLPAIISGGTAIIISPLIALMKNQVDLVRSYSNNDEIAHFMNSSLNKTQLKKVKEDLVNGATKLLYVAPETLTKQENIDFFKELEISFVAVDEAHCISEWGHDFRPEYRRIKIMIQQIDDTIPIIALTATATPKVRYDISKTLQLEEPDVYIDSFNRDNLFYEVVPKGGKENAFKTIVKFIQNYKNEAGIIYCLNRKTTEELAEVLQINGINARAYHAGMESKVRTATQDAFIMEGAKVIVATIAFGMGIDKPDVRFVIHYDIPKSLENYYQETGRAGRDGLPAHCLALFGYKDIEKLEKLMRDKPVAEREVGAQHIMEVVGYAETAECRRKFLLHYFGEDYDAKDCNCMCDNCKTPKEKLEGKEDILLALKAIKSLDENFKLHYIVNLVTGSNAQEILAFKHNKNQYFGKGKDNDKNYWNSIIRQAILNNFLIKEIENYGILKLTDNGHAFIKKPRSVKLAINHEYGRGEDPGSISMKGGALDNILFKMLKDMRKQVAKENSVPPFVVFQDPSLEDMATQYPINLKEFANITGVSSGKANRYGKKFAELIKKYVEENEIERPEDFVVKSVVSKSKLKVYIITNIDKKIPLPTIADNKNLSLKDLYTEIETIVASGTKVNIDYYINEVLDEWQQEEIYDYFKEAESDSLEDGLAELGSDEFELEDILLMRVKFMSEMAN